MRLLRNQKGQSLIEYVILVALVGAATIGMVRVLQKTVKVNMARVVQSLQSDGGTKAAYEKVSDDDMRKSDFTDFMNGTRGSNGK